MRKKGPSVHFLDNPFLYASFSNQHPPIRHSQLTPLFHRNNTPVKLDQRLSDEKSYRNKNFPRPRAEVSGSEKIRKKIEFQDAEKIK